MLTERTPERRIYSFDQVKTTIQQQIAYWRNPGARIKTLGYGDVSNIYEEIDKLQPKMIFLDPESYCVLAMERSAQYDEEQRTLKYDGLPVYHVDVVKELRPFIKVYAEREE